MPSTSDSSPIAPAAAHAGAGRFWIAFNDAWRGVTRKEIAWTLAIGLTFTVAHAHTYASAGRSWPFLVRSWEWLQVPSYPISLVAFRMAEHPQLIAIPQWLRYAIVIPPAALLYFVVSTCTWAVSVSGKSVPDDASAVHLTWSAVQALLVSVIVAIVYSSLIRSRRAQTAFDSAALQRAATARRVAAARLATLQAQVARPSAHLGHRCQREMARPGDAVRTLRFRVRPHVPHRMEAPAGVGGVNPLLPVGPFPRWRHNASLDWGYGPWGATLAETNQSDYEDLNQFFLLSPPPPHRVSSYDVWDVQARYSGFKNTAIALGVKNLMDRAPPFSNAGPTGWDPQYADPRGRMFYARLTYAFK